ncbi:Plexin A3 [Liparis tanakae]|uniref:Plexin A3 n=1 Tax=Liparis tanakae TaxID=230148 RepID=A0A4Z2GSE5_9TELE|nr:Plexin A3 [Liparis tanakae]
MAAVVTGSIGDDFCGQVLNQPLGGLRVIEGNPLYEDRTEGMGAVAAYTYGEHTVVFVGTRSGQLKKVGGPPTQTHEQCGGGSHLEGNKPLRVLKDGLLSLEEEEKRGKMRRRRRGGGGGGEEEEGEEEKRGEGEEEEEEKRGKRGGEEALIHIRVDGITPPAQNALLYETVSRLPVESCEQYSSCSGCLGSGDPHCGWCVLFSK